jgi:hypothetical protein
MEEIDKLEPETLRASGLTAEKLITIQKEIEAHIRSTMVRRNTTIYNADNLSPIN